MALLSMISGYRGPSGTKVQVSPGLGMRDGSVVIEMTQSEPEMGSVAKESGDSGRPALASQLSMPNKFLSGARSVCS